ncbi:uncharacterized protein LOC111114240 isoform X2 [Crassostrea virginica]
MEDVEDVNKVNYLGQTALHKAASGGETEHVQGLIDAGAELETLDRKCQTPLFSAVFNRRKEVAQLLLENGADPEGSSKNLNTPLNIAIMHKDVEMLKLLLMYNANTSINFSNGCVCAVHFLLTTTVDGRVCFDLIKLLLLHGCDIDYNPATGRRMDMSPLFACIFYLKPMAILVLLYEFGCRRWDFNLRDNRLYDTIEGGGSIKAFVTEKTDYRLCLPSPSDHMTHHQGQ